MSINHEEHGPRSTNECEVCDAHAQSLRNFFSLLEIPVIKSTGMNGQLSTDVKVNGEILRSILMDKDKLQILVIKLCNKAFW